MGPAPITIKLLGNSSILNIVSFVRNGISSIPETGGIEALDPDAITNLLALTIAEGEETVV